MPLPLYFRWAIRSDIPALLAIESQSDEPFWLEEDFLCNSRKADAITLVVEQGEAVVGYLHYLLPSGRSHIRLVRMVVGSQFRRQGIGTAMLDRIAGKIQRGRRRTVTAVVPERCLDVQMLLRSCGWKADKVLRGEEGKPDSYRFVVHRPGVPKDEEDYQEMLDGPGGDF